MSNGKLVAAIALIATVAAGWGYLRHLQNKVTALAGENAVLVEKLHVSEDLVLALRSSIDTQNQAIAKMSEDSIRRERDGKALIDRARSESAVHKRRADQLMTSIPAPNLSQCEAAEHLINQEIRSEKP
jgi:hypothetical protein